MKEYLFHRGELHPFSVLPGRVRRKTGIGGSATSTDKHHLTSSFEILNKTFESLEKEFDIHFSFNNLSRRNGNKSTISYRTEYSPAIRPYLWNILSTSVFEHWKVFKFPTKTLELTACGSCEFVWLPTLLSFMAVALWKLKEKNRNYLLRQRCLTPSNSTRKLWAT